MKDIKFCLMILLALLFTSASCSEDETLTGGEQVEKLEVSRSDVKLTNTEGGFTLSVTASGAWTATVTEGEWLTLSKTEGEGNEDFRLLFTKNVDGGARTGKVSVTLAEGSGLMQEISVEQLGTDPDILISTDMKEGEIIPFSGKTLNFQIVSNIEYAVEIVEKDDWIERVISAEEEKSRAFETTNMEFNVKGNNGQRRSGQITFRSTGEYVMSKSVEIVQEAVQTTLAVKQDEYMIPFKCAQLVIPIEQEVEIDYEVSFSDNSWIGWDKEASDGTKLVLDIRDNSSNLPRTVDIIVKNSVLERKLMLFQYGKPDPRIGDDLSTSQPLAFPGAEGGGRFTTGGRGGILYRVTTLADYGEGEAPIEGSLRYGIEQVKGPRTVIFDVSGIIEMKRPMFLTSGDPDISLIGQTAPGDGITLRGYNFSFNLSQDSKTLNAIVRFMRFRPGDEHPDYAEDGIGGRYFTDAIVDHVTASWSVDETFSFYGCKDFTAQWCMATESLNNSNHAKGAHGYGGMFSGDNASFHHILMAHHSSRCPRISDLPAPGEEGPGDHRGYFDVRNNVYYNWSEAGFGSYGGKYATFNLTNCYYKAGPATGEGSMAYRVLSSDPTARAYIDGNYMTADAETTADNWTKGVWEQFWRDLNPTEEEKLAMKMDEPQPFDKVTTHTAEVAYEKVLEYAGASLRRDAIDRRIVNEVRTGATTYVGSVDNTHPGIIDTVGDTEGYPEMKSLEPWPDTDGDGIPDVWEEAYGLNPEDADDAAKTTVDESGRYSNLEVYFHNLVQHIVYYQNQDGQTIEKAN